jgi:thioesterase domain-containing protein
MLVALEGSSPTIFGENNYKYYVWEAYLNTKASNAIYLPGPAAISNSFSGINIKKMADRATAYIQGTSGKIALIGWSRGAAACIQVAHNMNRGGKKIDAMFLFDAVDQDTSTDSDLGFIPASCVNVYHAIATKKSWMDRQLFPTCGKRAANGVNLVAREFLTSHGGIAGAGEDDKGSKAWMWDKLRQEGLI